MEQSGRIVIPTEYRHKVGLETKDEIIMHLDEEGLRRYTPAQAVAWAPGLGHLSLPVFTTDRTWEGLGAGVGLLRS